jgi:class 3 adenylate cyclase
MSVMTGEGAPSPGEAAERPARSSTSTKGFLFADLRGYTAYLDRRGAEAAASLLARYRDLVRRVVATHDGAEIRTEGDSFYVVFPSATAAVECALDIVRAASEEEVEREDAIAVGIGVHAGETLDTPEGPVGTAVNIAARLCALAGSGEVVVSDTVRALTRSVGHAAFLPMGRRTLKGIDEQVTVFRAVRAGTPIPARATGQRRGRVMIGGVIAIVVGLAAIAVVIATGGLRPGSSGEPSPSGLSSAVAVGSGSPSAPASTVPSDGAALLSVPSIDDPEWAPVDTPPGAYQLEEFRPSTRLEIDSDGWQASEELPDGFTLDYRPRGPGEPIDGIVTAGIIQVVFSGPCRDAATETIALDPKSLVDWLRANPALETSDPRSANLGSWSGLAVDITPATTPDCEPPEDVPEAAKQRIRTATYVFQFADNTFWLGPGEKARVVVVDVDGRPVTVIANAPGTGFDDFISVAQPIVDSLRFDPAAS